MIFDLIRNRRSIFPDQYNDRDIDRETLELLLEAANWAPTHKRTEPWRFKVFTGSAKEELGAFLAKKYQEVDPRPQQIKIKKFQDNPSRSAAVVAICMQRDPRERLPEWEEVASTAMAVQNMWLCCTQLGIGSYWSSPGLIGYLGEHIPMGEGERCLGLFYMGYHDGQVGPTTRLPITEKVSWFD